MKLVGFENLCQRHGLETLLTVIPSEFALLMFIFMAQSF